MIRRYRLALAVVALVGGAGSVFAQDLSRYRDYALESSVASVVAESGARTSDTTTAHQRPALIQQVLWRAPYVRAEDGVADSVRDIVFSFVDDRLYKVKVTYDREHVEGLTNDDVVASISATYGMPPLLQARTVDGSKTPGTYVDDAVVAQWEDETAVLTLTRGTFRQQFQLTLTSRALNARAETAISEAIALDTQERPQRELDARTKAAADALAATEKAREANKGTFKP